eukprot:366154-Chlamydomonas_euryale.AAC.9
MHPCPPSLSLILIQVHQPFNRPAHFLPDPHNQPSHTCDKPNARGSPNVQQRDAIPATPMLDSAPPPGIWNA